MTELLTRYAVRNKFIGAAWNSEMVKIGKASSNCEGGRKSSWGAVRIKKKGKSSSVMRFSVVVWSLVLFHLLNCCDWVLAGNEHNIIGSEGDNLELNYEDYSPYYDLPLIPRSRLYDRSSRDWSGVLDMSPASPFLIKNKRAAYGILGLATKRPHKTAAEIQHLPPQDAFMSVRGRKRRSIPASAFSDADYKRSIMPEGTNSINSYEIKNGASSRQRGGGSRTSHP